MSRNGNTANGFGASLGDPVVRRRVIVLIASLLFMLVGTGSIYFIVVAKLRISSRAASLALVAGMNSFMM